MTEKKVLVVAHGDLDGIVSAALIMKRFRSSAEETKVVFTQPFLVDKIEIPETIQRVFVVDIAVNNRDTEMTKEFIERLQKTCSFWWYDHHEGWETILGEFRQGDQYGLCVGKGSFTIRYADSAAQLIAINDLTRDAIASDTRQGQLSERGELIEQATKANLRDDSIRESAVRWIVNGCQNDEDYQKLQEAQGKYQKVQAMTGKLVKQYEIREGVAVVDVSDVSDDYDRTQLLIEGEQMVSTNTAVLLGKDTEGEEVITIATMDKGKNLVNLFGLPSGAPFRVSLPVASGWTMEKVLENLR